MILINIFRSEIVIDYYQEKYGLSYCQMSKVKTYLDGKPILVTGASGGMGESLLNTLKNFKIRPSKILCWARPSSNLKKWQNFCSEELIPFEAGFDISLLTKQIDCGIVFHFAGYAQPKKFMADPDELIKLNTSTLSSLCRNNNNHIIYASTTEVYTGYDGIVSETDPIKCSTDHPRAIYVYSKLLGESIISNCKLKKFHSFRVALATPEKWQSDDERVLAELIKKAKEKRQVGLLGGWDSVRSFQYGPLCVQKIILAAINAPNGVYNISGGELITLESLAKKVALKFSALYSDNRDYVEDIGAPLNVMVSNQKIEKYIGSFAVETIEDLLNIYA